MAIAADLLGQAGQRDGVLQVAAVQLGQDRAQLLAVLLDQRALGAPLGRVPEHIEGRAAQKAQARQRAEQAQRGRPIAAL
ncbi:hypothetical protein AZ15_4683, partial [Bordetella bronchiseptica A1-7]